MHARRIRSRPESASIDRRRLAAAGLSAILPGLGQAFDRRRRLTLLFLLPSLILVTLVGAVWATQTPTRIAAWAIAPAVLGALLTLNVLVLVWRLLATGQAFLDTRHHGPTGRLGIIGIALLMLFVVLPHVLVYRYGTAFGAAFARVFDGEELASTAPADDPGPGPNDRVNVLVIGVDSVPGRTATLTDTMMVLSFDPVGKRASVVSLPRDLINVPLGDGNTFGPKLNSLMSYADTHPKTFPKGGMRTLQGAIGALLGIQIQYYARMEFSGFISMVDAVGGVDVTVAKALDDPTYDGYRIGERGFSIAAGKHHLDGVAALAYARIRKPIGESDFTRQARQQQILVALRDQVSHGGSLLFQLPALLDAVGQTIRTDMPVDRLPALAAIMEEVGKGDVTSVVIRAPLVKPVNTRYGSSQEPNLARIKAMAAELFPAPGGDPAPWPTPKPTKTPKPKATPAAS